MNSTWTLWLELVLWFSAAFLWLRPLATLTSYFQLVGIWLLFFLLYLDTSRRKLPTMGLLLVATLAGIGWIFLFRLDPNYASHQFTGLVLGGLGFLVATRFNWHLFHHKYLYGLFALALLVVTLIFGERSGGAKAWLELAGVRFQPVEFARIFLLLFLAGFFHDNQELLAFGKRLPSLRYWGPLALLMGGVFLFLAVQRDLGPALLFYLLYIALSSLVVFRWHMIAVYFGLTMVGSLAAWNLFSHFRQRVLGWINPWNYPDTLGYQLIQGVYALQAGGFFGQGIGKGLGHLIPAVHTDYLFALIGEEIGLLGVTLLLLLYISLSYWGLQIARRSQGQSMLLATGIALLWSLHVFLVVGGILRIIPLTGMTLPFLSYGSSSLAANLLLLAILTRLGGVTGEEATSL